MQEKEEIAMKRRIISCIIGLGMMCVSLPAMAEIPKELNIYISPTGSASGDGSVERPYATLEQARDKLRTTDKSGYEKINVAIRGGYYKRDTAFILSAEDSGTEDVPIVYTEYPGEEAIITGAVNLEPSRFEKVIDEAILEKLPDEGKGNVYQLALKPLGLTDLPQPNQTHYSQTPRVTNDLIWEGTTCTLARWPNGTEYALTGSIVYPSLYRWGYDGSREYYIDIPDDPGFVFKSDAPRLAKWANAKDAWLEGYWKYNWAMDRLKIKAISGNMIFTDRSATFGAASGAWYFIFNLMEEMDTPGEWYIDHDNDILYVYPPTPIEETENILLTQLEETMLQVSNAKNIKFEKLTFEGGLSHFGNISNCENVEIAGCVIKDFSGHGLDITGGKNCGIRSCDVHGLGAYAVWLSGGSRETLEPCGHYSVNNHIYNYANVMKTYQAATGVSGVGCYVAYNEFHDAPHYAIGFTGNDHIFEYNNIHDVLEEAADAGAIYTLRDLVGNGTIVRYNYIHDLYGANTQGHTATGIYFDDGSSGCTAYGNILNRVGQGFLCGGGRNVTIENNIIMNAVDENVGSAITFDRRTPDTGWTSIKSNLLANLAAVPYQNSYWQAKYPEVYNVAEDDPGEPKYNSIRNNVIHKHNYPNIYQEVKDMGIVENNVRIDDPLGFIHEGSEQLNLREDSPVFAKLPEFKAIHFEKIGMYADEYRNEKGELR